jgi:hypothetical protein
MAAFCVFRRSVRLDVAAAVGGVSACLFALAACGSPPADDGRQKQLSGPVGTEHSIHPVFPTNGLLALAGCCSFDVGDAKVQRLEGDVDGRLVQGLGYKAIISFGNGLARSNGPALPGTVLQVDGVTLVKSAPKLVKPTDPRVIYRATVPLDEKARERNIANPGLEISGWCSSETACQKLTEVIETIRF